MMTDFMESDTHYRTRRDRYQVRSEMRHVQWNHPHQAKVDMHLSRPRPLLSYNSYNSRTRILHAFTILLVPEMSDFLSETRPAKFPTRVFVLAAKHSASPSRPSKWWCPKSTRPQQQLQKCWKKMNYNLMSFRKLVNEVLLKSDALFFWTNQPIVIIHFPLNHSDIYLPGLTAPRILPFQFVHNRCL